jgi:hypothetical protein
MPRESSFPTNDILFGSESEMFADVTETGSGVTFVEDTLVTERAESSAILRWTVMVLALVVFVYAGFLVWQLMDSPSTSAPAPARAPASDAAAEVPAEVETSRVEPVVAPQEPAAPKAAPPERKRSPEAKEPARRKPRSRPRQKSAKPAPTESTTAAEPVEIDIRNPYRN